MGDMNRNISQNRIAILAVSQYVKNRNNIESWPKYRSLSLSLSLSLTHTHTHTRSHTRTPHITTHRDSHTRAHFPLAVLLCFVRINEKSSLALGVISVLGVK